MAMKRVHMQAPRAGLTRIKALEKPHYCTAQLLAVDHTKRLCSVHVGHGDFPAVQICQ
jgi:hypothetical protein